MSAPHMGAAWLEACKLWEPGEVSAESSLDTALKAVLEAFRTCIPVTAGLDGKPGTEPAAKAATPPPSGSAAQPAAKAVVPPSRDGEGRATPESKPEAAAPDDKKQAEPAARKEGPVLPGDVPAPPASIPAPRTGPVPTAVPVSIFKVDVGKETAGNFFGTLRFRRNDPAADPVLQDLLDRQEPKSPPPLTARQLFAYSIPWAERGGSPPELPAVAPAFDHLPAIESFTKLGELATHHALQTAARMKRRSEFVESYASRPDDAGRAFEFFHSINWSSPKNPRAPQSA